MHLGWGQNLVHNTKKSSSVWIVKLDRRRRSGPNVHSGRKSEHVLRGRKLRWQRTPNPRLHMLSTGVY